MMIPTINKSKLYQDSLKDFKVNMLMSKLIYKIKLNSFNTFTEAAVNFLNSIQYMSNYKIKVKFIEPFSLSYLFVNI